MSRLISLFLLTAVACAHVDLNQPEHRAALKSSVMTISVVDANDEVFSIGTGFAISPDHIMTAAHVCDVHPNAVFTEGVIMSVNWPEDICILYNPGHGYAVLDFASRSPRTGDEVWIYGSPLGHANMLTRGYVSEDASVRMGAFSGRRVRIAAPAAPGNSGGPVLNKHGEVVGMLVGGSPSYAHLSISARLIPMIRLARIHNGSPK